MKFNDQRVNSIFKQTIANLPIFDFSGSEDLVFPFEVKTGFVNTTEEGIVFNSNVTDYARYERIFTGFEAVSAIWQNSTSLLVENDDANHPYARKNYQPGDAMLWHFDSHTFADNFTALAENSDYQKEQIVTQATYYSRVKIEAADVLKLYAIPAKYGKILMFIENVEEFYEPSTQVFKYAKISLRSLNDKLADTGLAIDQYVQFSCPGEGYAFPKLIPFVTKWDRKAHEFRTYGRKEDVATTTLNALSEGNTFIIENFVDELGINQGECLVNYNKTTAVWSIIRAGRGYLLDNTKLQNRPVVSAQFELYAPGVLSSVYAYGRPIAKKNGQGDQLTVSRYLPIESINIPDLSQRDVTKPLSQNSSNVWIPVSRTEVETWWKDWKESIQGDKNPGIVKQWEGYLRVKTASIPEHRFWNAFFKFSMGWVANAIWGKQLDSAFPTADITGSEANPQNGYWAIGDGEYKLPYLLNRNYWIHQPVNRVPLNYTESIPWTLKNVPLVGGIASKITLGLPIAWKTQEQIGGQNYNVTGMMPKSLFEFQKNTFMGEKQQGNDKYTAIPFDGLKDDAQPAAISPAEFATILNFNFTDQYKARNTEDCPVSNTQWVGFTDASSRRYEWQNDSIAVPRAATTEGYAIDAFGFHVLGSGTWKVTFFTEDEHKVKVPVYQGTYRTLSKLTNSIRDWSNVVKLSHWSADKSFDYRTETPQPSTISLPTNMDPSLNKMDNIKSAPDYEKNADGSIKRDQFGNPITKLANDGTQIWTATKVEESAYVQPGAVTNLTMVPTLTAFSKQAKDFKEQTYKGANVDVPDVIFLSSNFWKDAMFSQWETQAKGMWKGAVLDLNDDIFKGKQSALKQYYDNGFRKGSFKLTGSMVLDTEYAMKYNDDSDMALTIPNFSYDVYVVINADGTLSWADNKYIPIPTMDRFISSLAELNTKVVPVDADVKMEGGLKISAQNMYEGMAKQRPAIIAWQSKIWEVGRNGQWYTNIIDTSVDFSRAAGQTRPTQRTGIVELMNAQLQPKQGTYIGNERAYLMQLADTNEPKLVFGLESRDQIANGPTAGVNSAEWSFSEDIKLNIGEMTLSK